MRVKISYGIDLVDLPEEVIALYDKVGRDVRILENQSDKTELLLEEEEHDSCLSMILKMRETLGKIDSRLGDISNILEGYVAYNKQNGETHDTSERRSPVDTTGNYVVSGTEEPYGGDDEPGTESGDIS